MKSWKTTIGGIVTALGAALLAISTESNAPHWLKMLGIGFSTFGPGLLGLAARDNNVSSEDAGIKPTSPPRPTLPSAHLLALALVGLVLGGCASANQHGTQTLSTETRYPDGRVVIQTESRELTNALLATGDARQAVDKLRASNGKTLALGASGVQEDTSAQSLLDLLRLLGTLVVSPK
jgi:hypothetical protein